MRTTSDQNGSVWVTNRAGNSVVHVGLEENGQCVDRDGNGTIDTSTGLGDIRRWTNAGGVDANTTSGSAVPAGDGLWLPLAGLLAASQVALYPAGGM